MITKLAKLVDINSIPTLEQVFHEYDGNGHNFFKDALII